MYVPELYRHENKSEITDFIAANGFAILVSIDCERPWATHIPLVYESRNGREILHGHIAAENPQSAHLANGKEVLAIFSGPHSYISPSWYDHENVPTWNYTAVHVYGTVRLMNHRQTLESLNTLVNKYEANSDNPVRMEDLSNKTLRQARGVTAFEIDITEISSKRKLSQNRDDKNHDAIISQLQKSGNQNQCAIAREMRNDRPDKN